MAKFSGDNTPIRVSRGLPCVEQLFVVDSVIDDVSQNAEKHPKNIPSKPI